jgi:hypothetical protein
MKPPITLAPSKTGLLSVLAVAAFVLTFASHAPAQSNFTFTIRVDENGNGTFVNGSGSITALPFAIAPDPGPGGLANALTYNLLNPPGLTAGDLILLEPPATNFSEVIRFNPTQNGGSLVFYSDNFDGGGLDLADTGFPHAYYANTFFATEVGPEGNNGFSYTPGPGQPGFITGAAGPVTYIIISDVPEPCSLALCGLGSCLVAVLRRRSSLAGGIPQSRGSFPP